MTPCKRPNPNQEESGIDKNKRDIEIDLFWHILRTTSGYQSPRKSRFLVKNLPGWATCIYYVRLLGIIFKESIAAQKGPYDSRTWAKGSLSVIRLVESVGGKFQVSGLRGMYGQKGPFVYIANHMSLLDTFVLPCILVAFGQVTFVVKEGLLKLPVFGVIMRAVHPIAVTRRNPREDLKVVLTEGQELLSRGCSVIIFPQATRSDKFDAASFNSLGVKLARKAGVPVVPVALKTDFQQNGKIIKDIGRINPGRTLYLKFGEPMAVESIGQATHQKVVEFITQNLKSWGGRGSPES